ncbi:hypothetical protein [Nocardiopsis lambiniae]|uniref:Helix-turn-helix domain-containing protein n=1 Tax=Nocardiopsis lambiniae TaxID=3075539 RepID=A0ABU2MDU5_9ACTN|nr:hypothetical protein [Nocardiopsis sp. DSM 44743]MDT0330305.1 hypothetical protein [Nocardiopsis sp. DSM 44743]
MNPSPPIAHVKNRGRIPAPIPRKRPRGAMDGIGFIPAIWVCDAFRGNVFPSLAAFAVASIIADAADRDGRWCFLYLDTLVERSCGRLSRSTAKRAIRDLVDAGVVRKLPRSELPAFFAADLDIGRRRADNLPDVLELLIPADAFTRHAPAVLEEINEARARLGEEPLTPDNRPDLQAATTTGRVEPPRRSTPTPRDRSDRPTDLSPDDPCPSDPSPDPIRERATTGPPAPRQRISPDIASWALELLARIPDGALHHPRQDRRLLAARLADLRARGVTVDELTRALTGWEHTQRPFAALRARLASPTTVRDWNTRALLRTLPHPRQSQDAFSPPPEFTLDSQGRAADTCPDHPSIRNTPGGTCTLCGQRCRTRPDRPPQHPDTAPRRSGFIERLFGPPDIDERFSVPKCDNAHCNPDKASPRYRTLIRPTPDGHPIAVPCPTCGRRAATPAA